MRAAPQRQAPRTRETWPSSGLENLAACPACGAAGRTPLHAGLVDTLYGVPGTWTLHCCGICRAVYLSPRPTAATIGDAYPVYYYTHAAALPTEAIVTPWRRIRQAVRNGYFAVRYGYELRSAWHVGGRALALTPALRQRLDLSIRHLTRATGSRLLDVGCGNGAFLMRMRSLGWRGTGVDTDPKAVTATRAMGLDARLGTIRASSFPDGLFDAVTLSHVIEHFHDPVAQLEECYRVLRPGGVLWISTPNLAGTGYRRYGRNWRGLEPPRHLVLFTPGALSRLLVRAGFVVVAQPPSVGARWMFEESEAIRREMQPSAQGLLAVFEWHVRVWIADSRALLNAASAEEIVVIATKP